MQHKTFAVFIILAMFFMANIQAALPNMTQDGKPFPSLAPMIKKVHPAVLNISTFSTQQHSYNPLLNDPVFRHFFNVPEQRQFKQQPKKRQQSAGSGVVVNAEDAGLDIAVLEIKADDLVEVKIANSGGALVNLAGELVGINTAIIAPSGGNVGIGFAIPANMAKASMKQIIEWEYGEIKSFYVIMDGNIMKWCDKDNRLVRHS